jgi:hypothetical protein
MCYHSEAHTIGPLLVAACFRSVRWVSLHCLLVFFIRALKPTLHTHLSIQDMMIQGDVYKDCMTLIITSLNMINLLECIIWCSKGPLGEKTLILIKICPNSRVFLQNMNIYHMSCGKWCYMKVQSCISRNSCIYSLFFYRVVTEDSCFWKFYMNYFTEFWVCMCIIFY